MHPLLKKILDPPLPSGRVLSLDLPMEFSRTKGLDELCTQICVVFNFFPSSRQMTRKNVVEARSTPVVSSCSKGGKAKGKQML